MLMKVPLRSPVRAKSSRRSQTTLAAMKDPWLPMIAALSGQRVTTPSSWPVREVHRLDCHVSAARAAARSGAQRSERRQAVMATTHSLG
jgi:hypothetical protein